LTEPTLLEMSGKAIYREPHGVTEFLHRKYLSAPRDRAQQNGLGRTPERFAADRFTFLQDPPTDAPRFILLAIPQARLINHNRL